MQTHPSHYRPSDYIRMPLLTNYRTIQYHLALPCPGFSYSIRSCTASYYAVVVLVLIQIISVLASFSVSDFQGPFIRRYGITSCGDNLSFETSKNNSIEPSQVFVEGQACTSGTLKLQLATYKVEESGKLGASLTGERGLGDVYVIDVVRQLECSNTQFNDEAWFTFVKPDIDVTISWTRAFGSNGTKLQVATGKDEFTLEANVSYVIINSVCLYSSLSKDEYDKLRGEACFPADTSISLHGGSKKRIQKLSIGDRIATPSNPSYPCSVIGWTHWRPSSLSHFLRLTVTDGQVLTVSPRHFVYTGDRIRPARTISVGDQLILVSNDTAKSVSVVSIENLIRNGLFNVQTSCGDIVADNFLCSSYTEAVPPITAHALLLPIRAAAYGRFDVLAWTRLFEDARRKVQTH